MTLRACTDCVSTRRRLGTCFSWEAESNQSKTKRLHGQKDDLQTFRTRCEYIVSSVGLHGQTLWIRKFRHRYRKRSFRYKVLKTSIISVIIVLRDHITSYQFILIIWISILFSLSIRYVLYLVRVTLVYDLFSVCNLLVHEDYQIKQSQLQHPTVFSLRSRLLFSIGFFYIWKSTNIRLRLIDPKQVAPRLDVL